ncbi:MAG: CoA pyrophosphatase [Armatimonadota bacterium]|nr:CoA pyrophosphatase [Armatimonadota bacterium]MDR7518439.1 CoA pyrophosphatase [Armatimonadota bacterium]
MAEDLLQSLKSRLAATRARDLPPHQHRRAAVLVPVLAPDGVPHLLFTRRTETVEHHKGQISFPGGGEEPGDGSLLDTALRETYEELGIPPSAVEVWGRLDEAEAVVSGFAITPYVGRIPWPIDLRPNPNEIAEVVTVPLAVFLDPANLRTEEVERDGRRRPLLFYDYPPHVIWGVTARIVRSLTELLASP